MFENMFSASYWLTFNPPAIGGISGNLIFGFFVIVFIIGTAVRIVASQKTNDRYLIEVARRFSNLLVTMGLLGVLLFFFSYERIRFFGAKFWYPIWIIATALWVFRITRFIRHDIPHKRAKALEHAQKAKYFPRRRK